MALAFVAGIAAFAIVSVAVIAGDADGLVLLTLGLSIAGLTAMFRFLGAEYAVPSALGAVLAFDWFYIPPTHPEEFPDAENLANLLALIAVGVLVGELAALATRRAEISELARSELADDQAALRRVATLVAEGTDPRELLAAVAKEAATLLDVDGAWIEHYDDEEVVTAAEWSRPGKSPPTFERARVDEAPVAAAVRRGGTVVRVDDFEEIQPGRPAARESRAMSLVGAPIIVEGRQWGLLLAWSRDAPLPDEAEAHLTDFTELVATAIANLSARAALQRLADEQASLRRVATLVAEGVQPDDLFGAVVDEVGTLFGTDLATLLRYDDEETATLVATWTADGVPLEGPRTWSMVEMGLSRTVAQGQWPSRVDDWTEFSGPLAQYVRDVARVRSSVGSPIMLEGQLWGALGLHSTRDPVPAGAELRLGEFTELLGTAISNAQAREDLAASRKRIVAAADDERRRVVRDLHDGAQQRLVHTVVTLKMARSALEGEDRQDAAGLVTEALQHSEEATGELRELAHGIMPSVLARGGLQAGVGALASRMSLPVETDVSVGRLPPEVEATAYFIVAEALTNVAKHARAHRAEVLAQLEDGELRLRVSDDGVGGADEQGSGLLGLVDRLAVLGGTLRVESPADGGTRVVAAIPARQTRD